MPFYVYMRNLPISSEYAHAAESRYEIIDKLEDDSLDEDNLKQIRYLLPEDVNKVITVDADLFPEDGSSTQPLHAQRNLIKTITASMKMNERLKTIGDQDFLNYVQAIA